MRAIAYHHYGPPDVLKCEEVATPVPNDDQVLLKIHAASVNPLDRVYRGSPLMLRMMTGLRKPKDIQLGRDVAGEVEAVGKNVTQFKPGDAVFGACRGAFAEYACSSETTLVIKPDGVTFEQAASATIAGLTALQGLRDKGALKPGQSVLINGAAGGVGTFAVQIAKSLGADVTAVCSSRNVDTVRSIGADHVIDYTREDFTKGAKRYDLIFDCVGNRSLSACRRVMKKNGRFLLVGAPAKIRIILTRILKSLVLSRFVSQQFIFFTAKLRKEDLIILGDLMRAGTVRPVISRRYALSEVSEAIRQLEGGHARGKLVIAVIPEGEAERDATTIQPAGETTTTRIGD